MTWRRAGALVVGVALLVGAAPSTATAASKPRSVLHWSACGRGDQCARLAVPLDDTVPNGPTINLALRRLPASDPQHRIGSLLVNPGGPGAPATDFVAQDASSLPATIRGRFDIVGFDPRGSGGSAPVQCPTNLDSLYDLQFAPRDDTARQTLDAGVRAFVAQCQAKSGPELPYVSTERAARDMDRVRAALGDPKLTYLGYSYGTYLGALYADRFPTKVRAMVLDGAVDPSLGAAASQVQQAQGFEHDLDLMLSSCAADTSCPFHSNRDPGAAYDALRARLDTNPIPAGGAGSGRTLNGTEFDIGVTQFLYSGKPAWGDLEQALEQAAHGDGSALLQASDNYTGRNSDGTYSQLQAAFLAIGCLDGPDVGGLAGLQAIENQAAAVAPRLGRSVVNGSIPCAVWPVPTQPAPLPHAAGAPPIVVIGNTDDPATPLAGAQDLTYELTSALLVTVRSAMHTAYAARPANTCVDSIVNRYLLTLAPPRAGVTC